MEWYYDFEGEYTDDVKKYVFLKSGTELDPGGNVISNPSITKNFLLSSDPRERDVVSKVSAYFTRKEVSYLDHTAKMINSEELHEIVNNLELGLDNICKCGRKSSKIDICTCKYKQVGKCNCCENCRNEK